MLKHSAFVVGCLAGALLLLPVTGATPTWSQDSQIFGTTVQIQQQQRLQRIPGQRLQVTPDRPGAVLRTHCNGTCMCTGDDCTDNWNNQYCRDAPVCSSDPGNANRVCTCIKKAAQ